MLILHAFDEETPCDRAEKGTDYIRVFLEGQLIREDNGITDFISYSLTDEDRNSVSFSLPEPTDTDRLRALESAVLAMMMGGAPNV